MYSLVSSKHRGGGGVANTVRHNSQSVTSSAAKATRVGFSMKFFGALVAFAAVVLAVSAVQIEPVARPNAQCSCAMPLSVQEGYETDNTPVFKAEAIEVRATGDPHYSYTVFRVKVVFRGCVPAYEYILVKSPLTAAGCGIRYTPGVVYAITAKLSRSATPPPGLPSVMETYISVSCNFNRAWKDVSYDDKVFLYYSPVHGCSN